MKRFSKAKVNMITALVMLAVADLARKTLVAGESSTLFGIKEAELPGYYANLFFGQTNNVTQESFSYKISAFVWAKGIRSLAKEISEEIMKAQSLKGKSKQRGKQKVSSQQKKIVDSADNLTTKNKNVLQGLLLELTELEKLPGEAINHEILKSLDKFWAVFKLIRKDVDNFNGINVEAMIEEHTNVFNESDWERNGRIRMELAPLHMETIKPFLVSKSEHVNNNELARAFDQLHRHLMADDEQARKEFLQAKDKMRGIVGTKMFEELELAEPLLLRIDLIESSELRRLYQQMFSNTFHSIECKESKLQLDIRFIFGEIVKLCKKKHFIATNSGNAKEQIWDVTKIEVEIRKIERKIFKNRSDQTVKEVFDKLVKAYEELGRNLGNTNWEEMLKNRHQNYLTEMYTSNDVGFREFMDQTPGARARVHKMLGEHMPKEMMEFDMNVNPWLDKLTTNYLRLAKSVDDKSEALELLKARVNADVLLQLYWLERTIEKKKYTGEGKDEALIAWWPQLWNKLLLFLDHVVDASQIYTKCYGILLNNIFLKLRQWDNALKNSIELDFKKLEVNMKREMKGESPKFAEQPLMPEQQAKWLGESHRVMLGVLIAQADTEEKQQLRDLTDKQMKKLAKSLIEGPKRDIEWENWQKFIENRTKNPRISRQLEGKENDSDSMVKQTEEFKKVEEKTDGDEQMETSEAAAKRKGKAKMVEEEVKEKNQNETPNMLEMLEDLYFHAIADNLTEMNRLRAKTTADLLVQMLYLDTLFNSQAIWTEGYKQIFVKFLSQLGAGNRDKECIEQSAILYGNMLYKLRWQDDEKESWNLEHLLDMELEQLKHFNEWEQNGRKGTMPKVEPMDAEVQEKWLQNRHEQTIKMLSKDGSREFKQRMAALGPNEKSRLDKLIGAALEDAKNQPEKIISLPTIITAENEEKADCKEIDEKWKKKDEKEKPQEQQKEAEPQIYFECPKGGKSVPSMLQTPYVPFLKGIANADLEFLKREANLDTLEWHYRESLNKLLLISDPDLVKTEKPFVQVCNDWNELSIQCKRDLNSATERGIVVHNKELTTMKEQTLCKYHQFLVNRILKKKKLSQLGESKWSEMLEAAGFSNVLIKWLKQLPTIINCEEATTISTLLMEHPGLQEAHFEHLNWQIRESVEFRRFLCDSDSQLVKERLLELINPSALDRLEILYPDVLKIDKMHPKMRIHLYVAHRSDTPEAKAAELRIAFSLQLERLTKLEKIYAAIPAISIAMREKIRWLRRLIFHDHATLLSTRNICLMAEFRTFVDNLSKQHLEKIEAGTDRTEVHNKFAANVRGWNRDECEIALWQEEAMKKHRETFSQDHYAFITGQNFSPTSEGAMFGMIEDFGKRTRLRKLSVAVGCGKPAVNLNVTFTRRAFTNNIQLQKQLNTFFFGKDEYDRLAAHLGINFIVWNRWMQAQLDGKPKSEGFTRVIWHELQKDLLSKFDEIYDLDVEELLQNGRENLARIQHQITDLFLVNPQIKLLSEKRTDGHNNDLWIRLKDILTGSTEINWNAEQFEHAKLSIAISNREELLRLLSGTNQEGDEKKEANENMHQSEHNFKKLLLEGFEDHPEAKKHLPTLVGIAGVKSMAKALGWKKWNPAQFGLKTEQIDAAEKEEREIKKAEKEKISAKSVDRIAKELESIGVAGPIPMPKQKASKKKDGKVKKLASGDTSSSEQKNPNEAEPKESLLLTEQTMDLQLATEDTAPGNSNESELNTPEKTSKVAVDDSDKKSTASESITSESIVSESNISESATASVSIPDLGGATIGTSSKQQKKKNKSKAKMSIVPSRNDPQEASEMLQAILREKGLEQSSDTSGGYQRIDEAVSDMREIITHDWNTEAVLLFTGSYPLKLHTADADIDCTVLLPFQEYLNAEDSKLLHTNWELLYKKDFLGYSHIGKSTALDDCDLEKRYCPNTSSLYCLLCLNNAVNVLQRMRGRDKLPMIQVQFKGIRFYISFVSVPKQISKKIIFANTMASIPEEPENEMSEKQAIMIKVLESVRRVDRMIADFIDWKGMYEEDARKGMLWALSAYRTNLQMRDLLKEKPFEQFQSALLALKLWAKTHFIYGGKFGLLNGPTLTTMLLHVFFLENDNNHPAGLLIMKFFDTFIHWKWPTPVELKGAYNKEFREKYGQLGWNERSERTDRANQFEFLENLTKKHAQLVWPVITPGFPTQNAAFNVNYWTRQAIQREFGNGLKQMESIQETIKAEGPLQIKQQWNNWLDGGNFQDKYDHYLAIVCAADSVQQVRTFCNYVESRIRLQLLFTFGDLSQVKWMHASPKRALDSHPCPSGREVQLSADFDGKKWLCTFWLVGIQLLDGGEKQGIQHVLEEEVLTSFRQNEPSKAMSRLESFASKILSDFDHRQVLTAQKETKFTKELRAIYMTKEKLAEWLKK